MRPIAINQRALRGTEGEPDSMESLHADDASDAAHRTVEVLVRREQGALDDLEKMVVAERSPAELQAQSARVQALHRELVDARVECREAEAVLDRDQAQARRVARHLEAAEDRLR